MGQRRHEPKSEKLRKITIGPALARMRGKFNQRDVAKGTGITHQTISLLENNRGNPPLLTLATLTEFYGYEVADLFLPARVYKEYPNKKHEAVHAQVQEYIERGQKEVEIIGDLIDAFLGTSADEN